MCIKNDLKRKLKQEGSELVTNCNRLKLRASASNYCI